MDTYRETLCGSSLQHHAGIVEVSSIDPQSGFSILIDGALYGPFQKIRISPCTDRANVPIALPVAGYL